MTSDRWWRTAVFYQVYLRSFADADGDGVGDLGGLIGRLGYLRDTLGVDALWLSPLYPSPMADFGYDITEHTDVDPTFGTLDDVDALLAAAHGRGLRVIFDLVPSHTSDRHPWFLESRASRSAARRDWYVWRDPAAGGGPPNNWPSAFPRVGPAWTFDEGTAQWYLHSHLPEQPDLDWDNRAVAAAVHDIMRFWLARGVDGFRVDAVARMGKDPELRDNPDRGRPRNQDWPSVHDRLRGLRRVLDAYGDTVGVGEVWILDQRRLAEYLRGGDQLHMAHNLVLPHCPWDAGAWRATVDEFESLIDPVAWPAWFLSSHDLSRVASRYDEAGNGPARARVAALVLLTLRGTPFLYQGEELGLADTPVPPGQALDVDGRDPGRTPLPWQAPSVAGPGAGFTRGRPWLPITPQAERLNVASQTAAPGSTLALYRRLLRLRRASPALRSGRYRSVDAGDGIFAYRRDAGGDARLVVANFTAGPRDLSALAAGGARLDASTDPRRPQGTDVSWDGRVAGDEAVLLRPA